MTANNACLSRAQVCAELGIGLSTLKAILAGGRLRELRIGRRSLIPRQEIERFIRERLGEATAEK